MDIAVCICTSDRPNHLRKLLAQLALIKWDRPVSVIVVDNDEANAGLAVCEALAPQYRFPLYSIDEPEPSTIHARNTAMNKALSLGADFVAFIDDDQWPSEQWLSELMRIQSIHDSDAVGGPVITDFPAHTPARMLSNPYFGASKNLPDGAFCTLEASTNFLVRSSTAKLIGPQFFQQDVAQTGGLALAFFTALSDHGANMHWAKNAIVNESVSERCLNDNWMKQRVISLANSRIRAMQLIRPGFVAAFKRGVRTSSLFFYTLLITTVGLFSKQRAYEASLLRWKFWGKLTAHMNIATPAKKMTQAQQGSLLRKPKKAAKPCKMFTIESGSKPIDQPGIQSEQISESQPHLRKSAKLIKLHSVPLPRSVREKRSMPAKRFAK